VTIRRSDGRLDRFTRNPDLTFASPIGVFDTLVKDPDGSFTLTTPHQVQFEFGVPSPTTGDRAVGQAEFQCSAPYSVYTCDRAYDENDATQFVANNSGGGQASSLGVDLGAPVSIQSVHIVADHAPGC
jgi:hypothetical protein